MLYRNEILTVEWPRFKETARNFLHLHGRPMATYIAGPFSGKTREEVESNIDDAEEWGLWVCQNNAYPVIPHANTQDPRFEKIQNYEFWMLGTSWLLTKCDAALFIPRHSYSKGAMSELKLVKDMYPHILLFDISEQLLLKQKDK